MIQPSKVSVALEARTALSFDEAVARSRKALEAEGFGVLTEIDFAATMKKKLGVDLPPYLILGACHAPSAFKAFSAAPEVGVLLPCNVTVSVENGKTVIRAMDPASVLGLVGVPELASVGLEVRAALQRAITNAAG
ncbi:MAG: DUF302 domain-containing protein [Acidobacteriota bacterium]|nr:DUF302 domain-containing protein [Acidobacteriota bacterium]